MPGMSTAATAMAIALMTTRPMSPIAASLRTSEDEGRTGGSGVRTSDVRNGGAVWGLVLVDGAEPADPAVGATVRPETDREEHDGPNEERDVFERRVEKGPCPEGLLPEDVHRVRRRGRDR